MLDEATFLLFTTGSFKHFYVAVPKHRHMHIYYTSESCLNRFCPWDSEMGLLLLN